MSALDRDRLEAGTQGRDRAHRARLALRTAFALGLALLVAPIAMAGQADAAGFEGYVKSTALNVREQPGVKSEITGILLKYDPVKVVTEESVGDTRWLSIEASGGYVKGWVASRFIERGPAPAGTQDVEIDYGAKQTPTLIRGPFQYVGVRACVECHEDSTGDFDKGAVPVWEAHYHSQAYKSLQRDYTKEIAQRTRGVDDPANDWRCLKCHQSAYGAPPEQIGATYRPEEGVTCEVCHGPGSVYAKKDHGPDVPNREAMGFRILRNLSERREVCTSCHNTASPTFIGFDLRQFSRKIAHWVDKDDADYYAEADQEAVKRADRMEKAKTQKKQETTTGSSKAMAAGAGAVVAGGAAGAAAEAAGQSASSTSSAATSSAKAAEQAAMAAQADADAKAQATAMAKADAAAKAKTDSAAKAKADADAAAKTKADAAAKTKADATAKASAMQAEEARMKALADKEADALREAEARRVAEDQKSKQAKAEEAKKPAAMPSGAVADPLAKYLDDVDDVVVLNEDGEKYKKFKFSHKKHATGKYFADVECKTCHHNVEGDESPKACNECHKIGGDADEEKSKKNYVHTKGMSWPVEDDQDGISCISCHNVMNDMLKAGDRKGKKAPVKCTECHARNKS